MEPLGASTKRNVGSGGGSILSCCPRNPHGHERALKEEQIIILFEGWGKFWGVRRAGKILLSVLVFNSRTLRKQQQRPQVTN